MPSKTSRQLLNRSKLQSLAAWARVNIGMRQKEFCALSPVEWVLIYRQWQQRELREDLRVARLCQTIAAGAGAKIPLRDFLPNKALMPKPKINRKKKFKQTPAHIVERQLLSIFPMAGLKPQWRQTP